MRILTIGVPLPNREIDNYNLANAPSFFDYDVVIVSPLAVSQFIEDVVGGAGEYRNALDEPIYDGPTIAGVGGLAELIKHRRGELQRHLDAGGVVVCFAYPNAAHPSVDRFPGCDRYAWLPGDAVVDWSRDALLPGFGTEVVIADFEHPFASFLDRFRDRLSYRAYLSDKVRGHVVARSAGGAPIAMDVPVGAGRVIFLPSLRDQSGGTDRLEIAEGLVDGCHRAAVDRLHEGEPDWVEQFAVPGLDAELAGLRDAELVLEAASAQVAEYDLRVDTLAHHRGLLWKAGRIGLDPLVREALEMIGFTVTSAESEPLSIRDGDTSVFVEAEGSNRTIDLSPHYRLRKRWESELAKSGESRRGLVVINGLREMRPEYRIQQHEESLRVAAESMRYCVMTSADLFEMVCAVLDGCDAGRLSDFRRSLVTTDGIFTMPPLHEDDAGAAESEMTTNAGSDSATEVVDEG